MIGEPPALIPVISGNSTVTVVSACETIIGACVGVSGACCIVIPNVFESENSPGPIPFIARAYTTIKSPCTKLNGSSASKFICSSNEESCF